jgi:SAM-dependent methyltransferase
MIRQPFDHVASVLDLCGGAITGLPPFVLRSKEGTELSLEVRRWMQSPDVHEQRVLARAVPPVLDVGCGPARHTLFLVSGGVGALGLDVSSAAVRLAINRGAPVLRGSIFDRVPGEGRWATALVLDGNIGIGGDPHRLLCRIRRLLRPGGRALIELDSVEACLNRLVVRVTGDDGGSRGEFPWAVVGPAAVHRLARSAGFVVPELWKGGGRWFARLDAA